MINNGTLHYDHDRDGTHSQIAGCSVRPCAFGIQIVYCYIIIQVKFRNARLDTYAAISYVNRRITVRNSVLRDCYFIDYISRPCLQILTNIHGDSDWDHCIVVPDVDLPTGYFIGMSAATGDLAGQLCSECRICDDFICSSPDNHDIISVKTYDMGSPKAGTVAEVSVVDVMFSCV